MRSVLKKYVDSIIPRMIDAGYHLRLAKGGIGYEHLSEQTLFSHIVNGAFGLSRLWSHLDERGILPCEEEEKLGSSEFSISLVEAVGIERARLGLAAFVETDVREHRAANVHTRSKYHGDLALCPEGACGVGGWSG